MLCRRSSFLVSSMLAATFVPACTFDFAEPFAQSATGGAAGAAATGASGAGAASGGGAPPPVEDCLDGRDDDDDGLADCEDPDCEDHACFESAPAGWSGPGLVLREAHDASPLGCPDGLAQKAMGEGVAARALHTCSPCGCDPVIDGVCSLSGADIFDSTGCAFANEVDLNPTAENLCATFNISDGQSSAATDGVSVVDPGTCPPTGGVAVKDAPSFATDVAVCGEGGGGTCRTGGVCLPSPADGAEVCIFAAGDQPCPDGPFTEASLVYATLDDGRDCTPCTCGVPQGGACTGTTTIYGDVACTRVVAEIPNNGGCSAFTSPSGTISYTYASTGPGGTCLATGGFAIGVVTPSAPHTLCCLPSD